MKTLTGKDKLPLPFKHWDAKKYHGFLGKSADNTFFGVEMEYEMRAGNFDGGYIESDFNDDQPTRKHVNKINRTVGKCGIIKDDGSLNYGIEIASAPASYVRHKTIWDEFFSNMKEFKLRSMRTCGMHVHVSKDNLSKQEVEALKDFFSVKENQTFLEKIAGRKQNDYCNYKSHDYSKYSAVNTQPEHTIEFRIFKAPRNKSEFLIRLQLVRALTLWVRGRKNLTLESLRKFIARGNRFKELNGFIVKKKI